MPSATLIEKCCLIANPVAGNPTQYLVERAFEQMGLDWRFMTFEVEPERLGDAIRGIRALGFHGVKIGDPFNDSVAGHLDALSDLSRRCDSVNLIQASGDRLTGDDTVGPAFMELVRHSFDPAGRRVMVVGSGRMARVIALVLADAGVSAIAVASRNATTGKKLAELIQQRPGVAVTLVEMDSVPIVVEPEVALLVNATSLGMTDASAKLPFDLNSLSSKPVVADVAFTTSRTWLTQRAAERGCRIIDGLSLYVQQTAAAVRAWTGAMPDVAAMREAAEEFLGI